MSLEDFAREAMGKPPKNRDLLERVLYSDEDGCSFDQQVYVVRLPLVLSLAFGGALLFVAWAVGGPEWDGLAASLDSIVRGARSILAG